MTERSVRHVSDAQQRTRALDIARSCIVQAPAGSGKTELLIQRLLALLASVDAPEEILAITFTRKAAGEMQVRLIDAIARAETGDMPSEPHRLETRKRALAVLARDRERGWNLRENPSRLQIMTIDSFCSSLSQRMPWLARLGEHPAISDDAEDLYRQAAENLISRLETEPGTGPIGYMLQHLDNRMVLLRELLVAMLARRDQWLRHVLDTEGRARHALETALSGFVAKTLDRARSSLGSDICRELAYLVSFAADNLDAHDPDHFLKPLSAYKDDLYFEASPERWRALAKLLLTGSGAVRKKVDRNSGFPPGPETAPMKERMQALLAELASDPEKSAALLLLRTLPATAYDERQWQALASLIDLLPMAVVELRDVFVAAGEVDFLEIAGSARAALGSIEAPEDLLLHLDRSIRHILVDEYQDTSFTQYALIQSLTAGWEEGDGRTLFVVGDPMQSIYRFREADVGLFLKAAREGIGPVRLEPLQLSANFRSQAGLVGWFNSTFRPLFPAADDILTGAVVYKPAEPVHDPLAGAAVTHHYSTGRSDASEADGVLDVIRQTRAAMPDGTIAVLVRSRSHLREIVRLLVANGVRFQAQEIDLLADRPVAHDLAALTRALLHPGDDVSWLSLLRAPWAGLELNDLLALAGSRGKGPVSERIFSEPAQGEMFATLSPAGMERLGRIRPVLHAALNRRGRIGLRRLIESTWLALGGPAVTDPTGLADAERIFLLLEQLDQGGDLPSLADLDRGLAKLYSSPDPAAGPELQLMTIHRAKGLEFDTVILPGLGRRPAGDDKSLLRWLEHPEIGLLLAPVPPAGEDDDDIYRAIGDVLKKRDEHETLRLLYVAATRARRHLHLFGHVNESGDDMKPEKGSLLAALWDGIADEVALPETGSGEGAESGRTACIRRLPVSWRLPRFAAPVLPAGRPATSASDLSREREPGSWRFSLGSEEGRLIGTVVHRRLEQIALQGGDQPDLGDETLLEKDVARELAQAGIPPGRIDACVSRSMNCIRGTVRSDIGRWILAPHPEHACEVELSGLVDGLLIHASIDRTFVDNGIRWVIDYKTSSPADEPVGAFLDRETERYRGQIDAYLALYAGLEPAREIRGALYFPAIDAWRVVGSREATC